MRRLIVCAALATLSAWPGRLLAQRPGWTITPEAGWARYYGGSEDSTGTTGHPGRSMTWGARLGRSVSPGARLALGLHYSGPGLTVVAPGLAVEALGSFTLLEVAPEGALRILHASSGGGVWLHAGPVLDIWIPQSTGSRVIPGGLLAASAEAPLGDRLALEVRYEGVVSGSVFRPEDVSAGFRPRTMLRTRLGVGVRVGL